MDLTRMALASLDREGEAGAAARLQGAIDCVDRDEADAPLDQSAMVEDGRMWTIVVPRPHRSQRS